MFTDALSQYSHSPEQSRPTRLEARVSSAQKALFRRAAELTGRTLSDLVVDSTQEAATRIVREHDMLRLTREEQIAFVRALLNPPPPGQRLKQAMASYAQTRP